MKNLMSEKSNKRRSPEQAAAKFDTSEHTWTIQMYFDIPI